MTFKKPAAGSINNVKAKILLKRGVLPEQRRSRAAAKKPAAAVKKPAEVKAEDKHDGVFACKKITFDRGVPAEDKHDGVLTCKISFGTSVF